MMGSSLDQWLNENTAEAHHHTGAWFGQQGRLDEAAACYEQALALKPDLTAAHNNLGLVRARQGRFDEAVACYEQALRCQPDLAEVHNNLGVALKEQGKLAEAVASYEQALRLKPDYAQPHNNLGNVLQQQGQLAEAVARYQQALRWKPDYAEAHSNLGNVLQEQGKLDEALACYQQALRFQPDDAEAHWGRAVAWLLAGDFAQGWREYEWRWIAVSLPRFPQPLWDGSPLEGRTILLHAEQGLGDTLQFIRYAPLVQAQGGSVVVACPAALIPLLSRCRGMDRLVPQDGPLPPFDVYAHLLSLPRLLGTTLATVPAQVPYLFPDPSRVAHWRHELSPARAFKIGIAWQGSLTYRRDRHRSIPLVHFAPLAQVPGVQLISLQKGFGTEQLGTLAGRFAVTDLGSRLDETSGAFLETAAVMKNLDLVIAADTAIAHLAGGLGVPVWLVLSSAPHWCWHLHREDSPWYPTMRLFRPTEGNRWEEVFQRLTAALKAQLAQG